jgi:putative heme-binding domain-containing protein
MTTSSSGVTAYTGGLFPDPFGKNAVFVAESVSNLVHVDLVEEKGASFVASRHRKHKEFLASKDSWSRPVNMYVGPDGALYVLDYYRRIIEHPEWMADETVEEGGLYDGVDMGRIYRITPVGTEKAAWTRGLDLGNQSPKEWVSHLSSPNSWWRINAQRLLVDAKDTSVVSDLEKMANHPSSAEGRLHALWTLQGMEKLKLDLILAAFHDSEGGVRENAVKLAELHLDASPHLVEKLLELKDDPSAKVRFQLLCTLGFIDSPVVAAVREQLLFRDLEDEWTQVAALSAVGTERYANGLLSRAIQQFDPKIQNYPQLLTKLTYMVTVTENRQHVAKLLDACLAPPQQRGANGWQAGALNGLIEGVRLNPKLIDYLRPAEEQLVNAYFEHSFPDVRKSVLTLIKEVGIKNSSFLEQSIRRGLAIGQDRSLSDVKRAESLRFLPLGDLMDHKQDLLDLLRAGEPISVQVAAVQALGSLEGVGVSKELLSKWETFTPEAREVAVETFLTEGERVKLLLDALETKKVSISLIDYRRRVRLMNHTNVALRNRARTLLTKNEGEEVTRQFQQALTRRGTPEQGKTVYQQNCGQCHQLRGKNGVSFGPDLGTVHNWLPKDILVNILEPERAIAQGYDLWELSLSDGTRVQGMILSETSAAIGLRISPGIEKVINRQEIKEIKSLPMSLMPALGSQISLQEMTDLIAYIKQAE